MLIGVLQVIETEVELFKVLWLDAFKLAFKAHLPKVASLPQRLVIVFDSNAAMLGHDFVRYVSAGLIPSPWGRRLASGSRNLRSFANEGALGWFLPASQSQTVPFSTPMRTAIVLVGS
jgi:hypothetical protein